MCVHAHSVCVCACRVCMPCVHMCVHAVCACVVYVYTVCVCAHMQKPGYHMHTIEQKMFSASIDGQRRASLDRIKSATVHNRKGKGGGALRPQAPTGPTKAWTMDTIHGQSQLTRAGLTAAVKTQSKQLPNSSDLVVTSARIVNDISLTNGPVTE